MTQSSTSHLPSDEDLRHNRAGQLSPNQRAELEQGLAALRSAGRHAVEYAEKYEQALASNRVTQARGEVVFKEAERGQGGRFVARTADRPDDIPLGSTTALLPGKYTLYISPELDCVMGADAEGDDHGQRYQALLNSRLGIQASDLSLNARGQLGPGQRLLLRRTVSHELRASMIALIILLLLLGFGAGFSRQLRPDHIAQLSGSSQLGLAVLATLLLAALGFLALRIWRASRALSRNQPVQCASGRLSIEAGTELETGSSSYSLVIEGVRMDADLLNRIGALDAVVGGLDHRVYYVGKLPMVVGLELQTM